MVQRVIDDQTSLGGASVWVGGVRDGGGELFAEGCGYLGVVGEGWLLEVMGWLGGVGFFLPESTSMWRQNFEELSMGEQVSIAVLHSALRQSTRWAASCCSIWGMLG